MSRNDKLNQFDDLIDELQRSDERPYPPRAFKQELRGNLLNQYEQSRFSLANLGRLAGTAVAFTVLALVVYFSWFSFSQQPATISAQMGTVDVPGRDEFIIYDQLRLEFPMWVELDDGWAEMTAESWQSLDGTFFRGELVDANNKQRIFAQGDGQFLWRGTYDSNVERMETVSLQYFDVYHALAQAEGRAGNFTTPPFYDDVGWDGLVQSVVRLDWQCSGSDCVEKYLVEPPLGVNSRGGVYEPYGFAISQIGMETTGNGRSLTTYRIDYSPNQDGVAGSQYRLVKLDSTTDTVVEIADYDGDTLLRRLERVSRQLMTSADFPEDQFTHLPAGMGVSFVLPEGQVTTETPLLTEPNGAAEATLAEGTQVTLSGLMNNQLAVVRDGITWQYVSVQDMGQGWVNEANLQWPLTSDGQVADLDTSELPTAVPIPTQLTILRTYQAELQALLPETNGERLAQLEQALAQIAAEIARLEEDTTTPSTANDPTIITRHLSAAEVNPGEELAIILDWENQTAANTTIAVHLTDSNGTLLSQVDEPFSNIMQLTLPIPETAVDSSYTLAVIPYDATTGARINSLTLKEMLVETAVISDQCPCVWLTSATQYPRTSANDPITLIIDIAYQLDYGEKVILKPLYAHPDWEMAEDGRLPIDGLGDEIVLDGSINTFGNKSITFVENPAVMRDIVGTDYPVLVMQIRHLDENGEPTSEVTMEAMPNFTLDLTSTAEVTYQMDMAETMPVPPDNRLWITEATQLPRSDPNEAITLEVTVGYKLESAAEAMLSLSFIHPTQETIQYGFGYALGDEQRVQAGTGFVTITATIEPENITSAINSDEFKLMTRLWGVGENNEVPILISFDQEMAFNVQALEEVSYQSNSSVTNTLDRLGILDVSPPVGSVLNGRTTFTITVFYELTSMDTANLNTTLLPAFGGAAVLGNDQQIIERGSGELTYSFEFEPLEPDEPSTWMLDLRLESPQANPDEAALAAVSPHVDFPNDVYRFEP